MINFLTNSLSLSLGALVGNQLTLRLACLRQPRPMPHQFAQTLDHPLRLRYRHPDEELGLYGCSAGMSVLDLGCGTGVYTVEMARRVGESGRVYAVDLQQPLLDRARARVDAARLTGRVHFQCNGAYALALADNSVDLAVLIATLPQIPNKLLALAELSRVLKPDGRLVISEELADPAYVYPGVTRRWLESAGFSFGGQTGSFFCYHSIFFNNK